MTATAFLIFRTVELYLDFFLLKPRGPIFHLNHLTANHLQDILSFICPKDGINVFSSTFVVDTLISTYSRSSEILNTSGLPKGVRQSMQTKIRLLLKNQSDKGLPYLLF